MGFPPQICPIPRHTGKRILLRDSIGSACTSIGSARMRKRISSLLCATTLLVAAAGTVAIPNHAVAQADMRIGFDFFHNRLARDGKWIRHPIWGDVWHPRGKLVGPDF